MMKKLSRQTRRKEGGYTLVEILIAMVVLMISFLAVIAVETSTLQGYISSRDAAEAAELGRRIVEVIHVEGDSWRQQAPGSPFAPTTAPYGAASGPFDSTTNPLAAIAGGSTWTWLNLFNTPVSVNLANTGDSATMAGGRFCAWVRGGPLGGMGTQAIQVQVVVVYPGPNGNLTNCQLQVNTANLDNAADVYPGQTLEEDFGLRTAYFGTVVTPQ